MSDKSKLLAKREEICRANRTGQYLQDWEVLDTICDSNLVLYELKLRLNTCIGCEDYITHRGKMYCLKERDKK